VEWLGCSQNPNWEIAMAAIPNHVWIPGRKRRSKEDPINSKDVRSGMRGHKLIRLGFVSTRLEERNINQTLDISSR
jgi:hypothetical protein